MKPKISGIYAYAHGYRRKCGRASATLVIRSLVLGEVTFKDTFKSHMERAAREHTCRRGFGAVQFLPHTDFDSVGIDVALTVAITLQINDRDSGKAAGRHAAHHRQETQARPCHHGEPLITTIVDAFSLIIYFYLATLIINIPNLAG